MRKWGLIGLATLTIVLWSSVIGFYVFSTNTVEWAETHSQAIEPIHYNKSITDDQLTAHFERTDQSINDAETILGADALTQNWINDMNEDGKVSIDTVLESLNIESQ
ncbi:hypothetical protein LCM20_04320 [Halobacillus litoralis]|uniref:hypothetical protein n=1 Tax=Halobacillus litoralis TaxID=45668 RepID=UPI001CD4D5C2|nr:hypothetical protein [Halobacillus litoralis]MCA0969803.1 hypothetical protein [Halobacillus litoralis]